MPPAVTWLIRHGQSTANAGLPSADYEEVPLTALGHRQARERRPPRREAARPSDRLAVPAGQGDGRPNPRALAGFALRGLADPGADLSQPRTLPWHDAGDPQAVDRGLLAPLRPRLSRWPGRRILRRLHDEASRLSPSTVGGRRRVRGRCGARPVLSRLSAEPRRGRSPRRRS